MSSVELTRKAFVEWEDAAFQTFINQYGGELVGWLIQDIGSLVFRIREIDNSITTNDILIGTAVKLMTSFQKKRAHLDFHELFPSIESFLMFYRKAQQRYAIDIYRKLISGPQTEEINPQVPAPGVTTEINWMQVHQLIYALLEADEWEVYVCRFQEGLLPQKICAKIPRLCPPSHISEMIQTIKMKLKRSAELQTLLRLDEDEDESN